MAFDSKAVFRAQSVGANEPHVLDHDTPRSVDQDPMFEVQSGGTALFRLVWATGNKIVVTLGEWKATAIAAIHGGTGLTSYTLGDLVYSSAANTLAKLAGNTATAKKFLSQTGNGTISAAPVWETIDVADLNVTGTPDASTHLRGDGTWATTQNNYVQTDSDVLAGAGTSLTLTPVGGGKDLRISASLRSTAGYQRFNLNFNADAGAANYGYDLDEGATPVADGSHSAIVIPGVADTAATSAWGGIEITVFDYRSTTKYKVVSATGTLINSSGVPEKLSSRGVWKSTAAITSVVLSTSVNMAIGSSALLFEVGA